MLTNMNPNHFKHQTQSPNVRKLVLAAILSLSLLLLLGNQEVDASIGYFEDYGWPTYGIVKPFWMTPFSAFPSRSISGYSRKHPIRAGRGIINYDGF